MFNETLKKMAEFSLFVVLMVRTATIIMAAGESKRMGQNKLLLRLNDKTLIESVLDVIAAANIDETLVVLGYKRL